MTITHTWSIDSVTHDATTKRIKEIHWRIDSADGNHKSATYGSVELSTDVPVNRSAINTSLAINLVKNHLGEATIQKFIETLDVKDEIKSKLKTITPFNYTGI